jgi:acyl-CoA synthetase (AMP-forming)/AMP-acid ligase II
VCTPDAAVPVAALRAGARRWVAWLRAHGVAAGDRVVCALPPGPGFVMVLVAALWEELTFVPVPPAAVAGLDALLDAVDARAAVAPPGTRAGPGVVAADAAGAPPDGGAAVALRPRRGPPTPDARFLLETSGTTGAPRRLALSDANVRAVLASHAPPLPLAGATVLSVLPWHHAFGLVLELLPALRAGATLVRERSGGRDAAAVLAAAAAYPVTHLFAVPLTVRRLTEAPGGPELLRRLQGGVVGGAPADAALAAGLAGTRLRAGYGQTEASPGITLGAPGAWHAGALGRPVGCEVRLDADGVLAFRGPNAHLGVWHAAADGAGALLVEPPGRWVRTGDLARAAPDGTYTFEGRVAESFKLENGRFVPAAAVEARVRARWPHVTEALLSSPDGRALVLAVSTAGDAAPDLAPEALAGVLGPLAGRPLSVVSVPAAGWARTPKGELDRRFPTGGAG